MPFLNSYQWNIRALAQCQAAYDNMNPPEYYEDGEDYPEDDHPQITESE
ncbi:MAG: hypothetical protein RBQ99_07550 [Trichlorobacter sp.]|jgi:hypothetical protein|nr:hypothetical protein [Trichlorobacter sp.]